MKFSIVKESLATVLTDFTDIVSRKTTVPILSHILINANEDQLLLRGTDTEVTLQANLPATVNTPGAITVPGNKLLDVIRHLPAGSEVHCFLEDEQFHIKAFDSHFRLITLPAEDFPAAENIKITSSINMHSGTLNEMLQKVKFSMASQDVRYYLNGLYLNIVEDGKSIDAVTTDGHRLSCVRTPLSANIELNQNLLIPRKGIQELIKMLARVDKDIALNIGDRQLQLNVENYHLSTRLIDGQFPNYEAVLPPTQEQPVIIERQTLLQALQRAKVLLVDKHDGVRLRFEQHQLFISARNLDNETVDETIEIINSGGIHLETSLNINYLIEAVNTIEGDNIQLHFQDSESPCLITSQSDETVRYVIMPMRL